MKVGVVVADAADLILLGMETVLRGRPEFSVEARVNTRADLLAAAEARPQVLVIDERLEPDVDILQIVEEVLSVSPGSRVVVSGYLRDGLLIRDLLAAGCQGYLYKGDALREGLV